MRKLQAFKHRVQHNLEKDGFSVAVIADSTFLVDLLAIRDGQVKGYRVKAHGKIYKKEVLALRKFAHELKISVYVVKENAGREIVMWNVEKYS